MLRGARREAARVGAGRVRTAPLPVADWAGRRAAAAARLGAAEAGRRAARPTPAAPPATPRQRGDVAPAHQLASLQAGSPAGTS